MHVEEQIRGKGNQLSASASTPVKRQTAFLCTIAQLLQGEYVKKEGWEPSYVETSAGALSRVRLTGLIVALGPQLTLDDGTGTIIIRSFDTPLPALKVGTPVLIIGRPRFYEDGMYILVESCKILPSSSWLKYYKDSLREWQSFVPPNPKRELNISVEEKIMISSKPLELKSTQAAEPLLASSSSPAMQLIALIRELDPGDGAPVDEVLSRAPFDKADEKLQFLISEGEVFELRAGKIKVLE